MLKTLDGSGATDAWHGWFGKKETLRTRSEVRSPVGQSGLTVNSLARLSFQDVLQYVYVREAGVVSGLQPDAPSLNERLAQAREAHKVAALDGALARSRWTHAVDARRIAETRFRKERRGALAFADAVVNEHWLANSLASRVAHLCMKRHALHAVALRLPQHLGLV